jgi:carbonic anhydrase
MKITAAVVGFVAALMMGPAFAEEHHGAPHWTYDGATGPTHWSELEESNGSCKLGKEQSPIDIPSGAAQKAALAPIKASYTASAGELVNNGHTIQVNLTNGGGMSAQTGEYKIVQFHFHTPSEEKIDGKNTAMVAHLVHKNASGNLGVIAVLIKEGRENAALKGIFSALPAHEGKAPLAQPFDVSTMLPASLTYYSFKGSLTTPPCSEGVAWHVLKQPIEMSHDQIAAFQKVFKMNARPVQPLNGRQIQINE